MLLKNFAKQFLARNYTAHTIRIRYFVIHPNNHNNSSVLLSIFKKKVFEEIDAWKR